MPNENTSSLFEGEQFTIENEAIRPREVTDTEAYAEVWLRALTKGTLNIDTTTTPEDIRKLPPLTEDEKTLAYLNLARLTGTQEYFESFNPTAPQYRDSIRKFGNFSTGLDRVCGEAQVYLAGVEGVTPGTSPDFLFPGEITALNFADTSALVLQAQIEQVPTFVNISRLPLAERQRVLEDLDKSSYDRRRAFWKEPAMKGLDQMLEDRNGGLYDISQGIRSASTYDRRNKLLEDVTTPELTRLDAKLAYYAALMNDPRGRELLIEAVQTTTKTLSRQTLEEIDRGENKTRPFVVVGGSIHAQMVVNIVSGLRPDVPILIITDQNDLGEPWLGREYLNANNSSKPENNEFNLPGGNNNLMQTAFYGAVPIPLASGQRYANGRIIGATIQLGTAQSATEVLLGQSVSSYSRTESGDIEIAMTDKKTGKRRTITTDFLVEATGKSLPVIPDKDEGAKAIYERETKKVERGEPAKVYHTSTFEKAYADALDKSFPLDFLFEPILDEKTGKYRRRIVTLAGEGDSTKVQAALLGQIGPEKAIGRQVMQYGGIEGNLAGFTKLTAKELSESERGIYAQNCVLLPSPNRNDAYFKPNPNKIAYWRDSGDGLLVYYQDANGVVDEDNPLYTDVLILNTGFTADDAADRYAGLKEFNPDREYADDELFSLKKTRTDILSFLEENFSVDALEKFPTNSVYIFNERGQFNVSDFLGDDFSFQQVISRLEIYQLKEGTTDEYNVRIDIETPNGPSSRFRTVNASNIYDFLNIEAENLTAVGIAKNQLFNGVKDATGERTVAEANGDNFFRVGVGTNITLAEYGADVEEVASRLNIPENGLSAWARGQGSRRAANIIAARLPEQEQSVAKQEIKKRDLRISRATVPDESEAVRTLTLPRRFDNANPRVGINPADLLKIQVLGELGSWNFIKDESTANLEITVRRDSSVENSVRVARVRARQGATTEDEANKDINFIVEIDADEDSAQSYKPLVNNLLGNEAVQRHIAELNKSSNDTTIITVEIGRTGDNISASNVDITTNNRAANQRAIRSII